MLTPKNIRNTYQPQNESLIYKIFRLISSYLSWLLLRTPLTANGVTIVAIIIGILGSYFISTSNFVIGVLLVWIAIVLDFCDGEIARIKNQKSLEGEYLDHIYHFSTHPAYFAGLLLCLYNNHIFTTSILLCGLINCILVIVNDFVQWYAPSIVYWDKYLRDLKNKEHNIKMDIVGNDSIDVINIKYSLLKKIIQILNILNRNLFHFPGLPLFMSFVLILEVIFQYLNPLYQGFLIIKYYIIVNAILLLFWYIFYMIITIFRKTVTTNFIK